MLQMKYWDLWMAMQLLFTAMITPYQVAFLTSVVDGERSLMPKETLIISVEHIVMRCGKSCQLFHQSAILQCFPWAVLMARSVHVLL